MAVQLRIQPPRDNNEPLIRNWPGEEQEIKDAQKVMKLTSTITKFNRNKEKFGTWWRNVYNMLEVYELSHHILVKDQIPPAGADGAQLFKRRRLNRIVVQQTLKNLLKGEALQNVIAHPDNIENPRQIMEFLSETFNKKSQEDRRTLETAYVNFLIKPNESISGLDVRFTKLLNNLQVQEISKDDKSQHETFLGVL